MKYITGMLFTFCFCDGFVINNNKFSPLISKKIVAPALNMIYKPSQLIRQVSRGGLGEE